MSSPADFDFDGYTERVVNYTCLHLSPGQTEEGIAGRVHLLTTAVERDLLRFGEKSEFARMACAPGCSSCCVVNISVLAPEAIAIAWFLKRRLDNGPLASVKTRLHELHRSTRWLDDEERLYLRESCAFLDPDGKCLIHTVRPLLCRSITSLDGNVCREAIASVPLGESPVVMMNLFQKALFEAVYQGLAQGLSECGLDDRPWQLTTAIHNLLHDDTVVDRFVSGEPIVCQ